MVSLFETILTGIGDILGLELIVFLMICFAFLSFMFSRGLGITSLTAVFVFIGWALSNNAIEGVLYLNIEYFILIIILFGFFLGFIVYQLFIRP